MTARLTSVGPRKAYVLVFLLLTLLTVAEVGVVYVPAVSRALLISALVLLALAKAGLVLMTYMHLGHEARALRLTVLVPFVFPALYAFVLMAEASWRFLR
ncbi:MAG: cytochrome C oxidase subunit IV family protein [Myxococcales bacterium]|nr:cytochrome C oxidase subunit IV family protein [Myxococcales bacterium]